MSDDGGEEEAPQKKFFVDRAKTGRATCKKCKQKLDSGELRLAKAGYNPFGPGVLKQWHHVPCLFEVFSKQRATTAKIDTPDDVEGWSDLDEDDQKEILGHLPHCKDWKPSPKTPSKDDDKAKEKAYKGKTPKGKDKDEKKELHKDDSFREFRRLCAALSETDSYTGKTALVREWLTKGSDQDSFKGDVKLWCRLLLPEAVKRVYNLQSKQIIKLFSKIFHADHDKMLEDLEKGDVAETVRVFFEKSKHTQPAKKSTLYLQDVDKFLEELSGMTKEEEQTQHFKQMAKKCTSNDLKMIVRLIKHDLRIKAGPKHILEAVHADAYQAFQTSRDMNAVLSQVVGDSEAGSSKKTLKVSASLMTPVLPMLSDNKQDSDGEERVKVKENGEHEPSRKKRRHDEEEEDRHRSKRHHKEIKTEEKQKNRESKMNGEKEMELTGEEDELNVFGDYVAHEIRALNSEENRRELKRVIEKAIIEMAALDDSQRGEEK